MKQLNIPDLSQKHITKQIHAYLTLRGPSTENKDAENYHAKLVARYFKSGFCHGIALLLLAAELNTLKLQHRIPPSLFSIPQTSATPEEKKITAQADVCWRQATHTFSTIYEYFIKISEWNRKKDTLSPAMIQIFEQMTIWIQLLQSPEILFDEKQPTAYKLIKIFAEDGQLFKLKKTCSLIDCIENKQDINFLTDLLDFDTYIVIVFNDLKTKQNLFFTRLKDANGHTMAIFKRKNEYVLLDSNLSTIIYKTDSKADFLDMVFKQGSDTWPVQLFEASLFRLLPADQLVTQQDESKDLIPYLKKLNEQNYYRLKRRVAEDKNQQIYPSSFKKLCQFLCEFSYQGDSIESCMFLVDKLNQDFPHPINHKAYRYFKSQYKINRFRSFIITKDDLETYLLLNERSFDYYLNYYDENHNNSFNLAVIHNSTKIISHAFEAKQISSRTLTELISDEKSKNTQGENIIHLAARYLSVEIYDLIIEKMNSRVYEEACLQRDHTGLTPLMSALKYAGSKPQCIDMIKRLIASSNITLLDNDCRTVVHYVASGSYHLLNIIQQSMPSQLDYQNACNQRDADGLTPLMWLLRHCPDSKANDFLDRVKLLIPATDLNLQDTHGRTALHYAAARGETAVLIELWKAKANLITVDHHGNNVLHFAAQQNRLDCVTQLLQIENFIDCPNDEGRTAFSLALESGHLEVASNILFTLHPKTIYRHDLHVAARLGASKIIQGLLAANVDPNSKDEKGNTPLALAAVNNHLAAVSCLLADERTTDEPNLADETAFFQGLYQYHTDIATEIFQKRPPDKIIRAKDFRLACCFNLLEIVKQFLKVGVDFNSSHPSTGNTALHLGVVNRQAQVVELLLEQKAISHKANVKGQTPLSLALVITLRRDNFNAEGQEKLSLALDKALEKVILKVDSQKALSLTLEEIKLNVDDQKVLSAEFERRLQSFKIVDMIFENIESRKLLTNPIHRYDLHCAVILNKIKIVDYLLKAGANPNQKDEFDKTPLMHAKQLGYKRIEHLLNCSIIKKVPEDLSFFSLPPPPPTPKCLELKLSVDRGHHQRRDSEDLSFFTLPPPPQPPPQPPVNTGVDSNSRSCDSVSTEFTKI